MDLTNLISYWALNESSDGSGSVQRNDSHGTNHLSDAGTTPSTTGLVYPLAANVEAINTEGFFLADNPSVSLGGGVPALTVAAWVKLTSHTADMTIVSKGSSPDRSYALGFAAPDRFFFSVWESAGGGGAHAVNANSLGAPSDGVWYFLVGMLQTDGSLQIQINDGTVDDAGAGTVAATFDEAGEFDLGFVDLLGNFLDATLGPVMLWKRVLTATERTFLYNGGAGRTYADMAGAGVTWRPLQQGLVRGPDRVIASGSWNS